MTRAIDGARTTELDLVAKALWAAHATGALDDDAAQAMAEAIQARRCPNPPAVPACRGVRSVRKPRPAERQRSIERRRRLAASGPLPPSIAAKLTVSEQAVLRVVGDECRDRGCCALHLDAIAARAGTCRTTVRNALRTARRLGLVLVRERRRRGQRSLTNIVTIVSAEWRTWLARGGGRKNLRTTDIASSQHEKPPGLGALWQRYARPYDPGSRDYRTKKDADAPGRRDAIQDRREEA